MYFCQYTLCQVFSIFTGFDNNVTLTNYGHCNFISGKHACIFFDEVRLAILTFLFRIRIF